MTVQEQIDWLRDPDRKLSVCKDRSYIEIANTLEKLNARNIKLEAVYEAAKKHHALWNDLAHEYADQISEKLKAAIAAVEE